MHWCPHKVSHAVREHFLRPLSQLSWIEALVAFAIGVLGGVFPVPLVTALATLAIGGIAQCSTLELLLGSTVNLFCTPLQFTLLPIFARLMGSTMQVDTTSFTAHALRDALGKGYGVFLRSCGWMVIYAVFGWLLVAIPATIVLHAAQRCITHDAPQKDLIK